MIDTATRGHPADGDLVRLLDGEHTHATDEAVRVHLERCDTCAIRLRRLRQQSAALDLLLTASANSLEPPPVPQTQSMPAARNRSTMRWRAAAAVILLLGMGLLAPPVRAWVVDRVEAMAMLVAGDPSTGTPALNPTGTLLRLQVHNPRLVVEVVRPASGAVLQIRRVTGAEVILEVVTPGSEVVLLPDGLRLDGGSPGAVYRLALPATVTSVEVRTTEDVRVIEVASQSNLVREIPLAPEG